MIVLQGKEKALAMFNFIDAFNNLQELKVFDITKEVWYKKLSDIKPVEGIVINYQNKGKRPFYESEQLLSVQRQPVIKCHLPDDCFAEWLLVGWNDYRIDTDSKKELVCDEKDGEKFAANPKRVEKYKEWKKKRIIWAKKQKENALVNSLYLSLRNRFEEIKNSNKQEIFIADGLLETKAWDASAKSDVYVKYPLLLKKVKIEFDANSNTVHVVNTENVVEFSTELFDGLSFDNINLTNISKHEVSIRNSELNPWDEKGTEKFFKLFLNDVCKDGGGQYITDNNKNNIISNFVVYKSPMLVVRNKKSGVKAVVKEIIEDIQNNGIKKGAVFDLFTDDAEANIPVKEKNIEELLAATSGESLEILLAKKANKEQLEIVERIDKSNGVLVQGPPGTGKTHTIANLIGHFVAKGKTVLVTSEKKKALEVVKEKLPEGLQSLCVSLLNSNSNSHDMESAVDGMIEYAGCHDKSNECKRISEIQADRAELLSRINNNRTKIYAARNKSHKYYSYNGDSFDVITISKFLAENEEKLSYIPGFVKQDSVLPLNAEEIQRLYASNSILSVSDCEALKVGLPNPDDIINDTAFEYYVGKKAKISLEMSEICNKIGSKCKVVYELDDDYIKITNDRSIVEIKKPDLTSVKEIEKKLNIIKDIDNLEYRLLCDGARADSNKECWSILFKEVEDTYNFANEYRGKAFGMAINVTDMGLSDEAIIIQLEKMKAEFSQGNSISKITLFFNSKLKKVYNGVRIDDSCLTTAEHCELAIDYIKLEKYRKNVAAKWNELIPPNGGNEFNKLSSEYPEITAGQIAYKIAGYLNWYSDEFSKIKNLLGSVGFNTEEMYRKTNRMSDDDFKRLLDMLSNELPIYLKIVEAYAGLKKNSEIRNRTVDLLSKNQWHNNRICSALLANLVDDNISGYREVYRYFMDLYNKSSVYMNRMESLKQLQQYAPDWVNAINNRVGVHGLSEAPYKVEDAWKWKQFEGFYNDLSDDNISILQNEIIELGDKLRELTAKLICVSAWSHLLTKFEEDGNLKKALNGWKQLRSKIGKTKSLKNINLKEDSNKKMIECQRAVPAWVMTVDDALTSFSLKNNKFDVIIIDEASQSDLRALPLLYMAQKVIIVGDDKQVSPLAVGIKDEDITRLGMTYLQSVYPNDYRLFDSRYSIYEFAALNYKSLMLREHFRCVPDIIGYCNNLSYDGKILPLREVNSTKIQPAMVQYRVKNGKRDNKKKINIKEGEAIVALLMACAEHKAYAGKTFGVISLLGTEQVNLIKQLIYSKLPVELQIERDILVGDSASFQGDERDVIFSSMVDSSEGEPLRKKTDGGFDAYKKRYNVAVSRAKDQFWVVHSLDYKNDLKSEDLRRGLLDYIDNPNITQSLVSNISNKADSEFEIRVGKALVARGYDIEPQHSVGSYRIDLIIRNTNIAIECDGEAYHSGDEKVREDMERQAILERLGWRFIRIRGGEFFRNEEKCIDDVIVQLERMGARKITVEKNEKILPDNNILECIKARAGKIMQKLQDNEEEEFLDSDADNMSNNEAAQKESVSEKLTSENNVNESRNKVREHFVSREKQVVNIKKKNNKEDDFCAELGALGEVVDKLDNNNTLWVIAAKGIEPQIREIANKYGLSFTFEVRGGMATKGQPAWFISRKGNRNGKK